MIKNTHIFLLQRLTHDSTLAIFTVFSYNTAHSHKEFKMRPFETNKIDNLADVFCAVIGGRPDSIREIDDFIKTSNLKQLLSAPDIEKVIKYDGFFADETIDAVYALLPVKLKLNSHLSMILTPQAFRKLNAATISKPASRLININFQKALSVTIFQFEKKFKEVKEAIEILQQQRKKAEEERKQKELLEQQKKQAELEKLPQKTPEQQAILQKRKEKEKKKSAKQIETLRIIIQLDKKKQELEERSNTPLDELPPKTRKKEKNRRRVAAARAKKAQEQASLPTTEQPKKSSRPKLKDLPKEQQDAIRAANRRHNDVYRAINRAEIRARQNAARAKMKIENPEKLKELDHKSNTSEAHKRASNNNYILNKEKKDQQNKNNPNRSSINKKYKAKKRFAERTGPTILSLLQGIALAKIK